jgi:hypothetical protein
MSRSSVVPGLLLIAAGALLASVPHVLLPVCGHGVATAFGGSVPMKCFWTARAELGVGALTAFGGLAYCLCRDTAVRLGIAAMSAAAGLLAVAFPTLLIGVCARETMPCRTGALPGLVLAGAAVFFVSAVAGWRLWRLLRREKAGR